MNFNPKRFQENAARSFNELVKVGGYNDEQKAAIEDLRHYIVVLSCLEAGKGEDSGWACVDFPILSTMEDEEE